MDRIPELKRLLDEIERANEDDIPFGKNTGRREAIVKASIEAGDDILMEFFDGSREELDYLTHEVALEWVTKAVMAHRSAILAKDLGSKSNPQKGTQGEEHE